MKLYLRNRLRAHILRRWIIQLLSVLFLLIILLIYFIFTHSILKISYVIMFVLTVAVIITATSFKRNFSVKMNSPDVEILKVVIAYLTHKKMDLGNNRQFIREKFKPFKEKQFYEYLDHCQNNEFNFEESIISLASENNDIKIFLLELLFDISLAEGILKKEDEDFIDSVGMLLNLNFNIYLSVKNTYIQRGLKTEREIYHTGKEQIVSGSFKLLNACEILNVKPDVNNSDLKKAFRNMAKQYHPDKFHGMNTEKKRYAEEKFQEIKSAYETIIKHKGY